MDWNELQSLTWLGYARKNGGKGSPLAYWLTVMV